MVCSGTTEAWIFLERTLRRFTGNRYFYLNDSNKILGYNLDLVPSVLVTKLLCQIWNARCKLAFNDYSSDSDIDIIFQFKRGLKYFLLSEKIRLGDDAFQMIYAKNNVLCSVEAGSLLKFCL